MLAWGVGLPTPSPVRYFLGNPCRWLSESLGDHGEKGMLRADGGVGWKVGGGAEFGAEVERAACPYAKQGVRSA